LVPRTRLELAHPYEH